MSLAHIAKVLRLLAKELERHEARRRAKRTATVEASNATGTDAEPGTGSNPAAQPVQWFANARRRDVRATRLPDLPPQWRRAN